MAKKAKNSNVHEVIIKIEGKEWKDACDKAFAKKQKNVKIDGFQYLPGLFHILEREEPRVRLLLVQ